MIGHFEPPEEGKDEFHCPHCSVYAHHKWVRMTYTGSRSVFDNPQINTSECQHCDTRAIWVEGDMIYPKSSTAPMPAEDMPEEVRADFMEARRIVDDSPRAAAALLRLSIEKLLDILSAEGDSIYYQIGDLVEKGEIDSRVQKAYDAVRVFGNESVHPGEIDMRDDENTAHRLFELVNVIVQSTIQEEKLISEVYESIPENKKDGIDQRDSN